MRQDVRWWTRDTCNRVHVSMLWVMKGFESPVLSVSGVVSALKRLEPRDALTAWQVRYFEKQGCLRPVRVNGGRFYSRVDVALLRTSIKLTEHFWSRLGIGVVCCISPMSSARSLRPGSRVGGL